jgi:hypothetical protein
MLSHLMLCMLCFLGRITKQGMARAGIGFMCAEDGAPYGATLDSESSCHGELSVSKKLETENGSEDSNDSSNHTAYACTEI